MLILIVNNGLNNNNNDYLSYLFVRSTNMHWYLVKEIFLKECFFLPRQFVLLKFCEDRSIFVYWRSLYTYNWVIASIHYRYISNALIAYLQGPRDCTQQLLSDGYRWVFWKRVLQCYARFSYHVSVPTVYPMFWLL